MRRVFDGVGRFQVSFVNFFLEKKILTSVLRLAIGRISYAEHELWFLVVSPSSGG